MIAAGSEEALLQSVPGWAGVDEGSGKVRAPFNFLLVCAPFSFFFSFFWFVLTSSSFLFLFLLLLILLSPGVSEPDNQTQTRWRFPSSLLLSSLELSETKVYEP